MATLEFKNIGKSFGSVEVLKDINLEIGHGDFLVLVGPSGCGKSTLLGTIAGLQDITTGSVLIDGETVNDLEPKERDIAMVFQSYALYPSMTVAENIAFSLRMQGVPKSDRMQKVREVADLLQIDHLLNRKPQALSGGQRQRVAMGRALVRDPKVFLFDEPLSNLDAKLRVDMRTEIKKLHQRLGTTIVYVTHDQVEAMTMATQIAVMRDGIVQQFGTPDEIYQTPANTFVATFMGSPAMNLVDGAVANGRVQITDGQSLPIPASAGSLVDGRRVKIGLRPEWFSPVSTEGKSVDDLTLSVDVIEPTGPDIYVALHLGGTGIMARLSADARLKAGATQTFKIDHARAVLFDAETGNAIYQGTTSRD